MPFERKKVIGDEFLRAENTSGYFCPVLTRRWLVTAVGRREEEEDEKEKTVHSFYSRARSNISSCAASSVD